MKDACVWCDDSRKRLNTRIMKVVRCRYCEKHDKVEQLAVDINALPKSARPVHYDSLSPDQVVKKYAERVRTGKTKKDHGKKGIH